MSPRLRIRRADRAVGDLLLACVRDPEDPGLPERLTEFAERGRLGAFLGLAERHRVLGQVAGAVRAARGIPPEDRDGLEARLAQAAARHLRVLEELRGVAAALEGLRWFVAKGPVLAETVYPGPEVRPYGDLDLFVEAARFEEAISTLIGAGASIEDRNWSLLRAERRGQLHIRLPLGTLADVHWHLLNRGAVRDLFRVRMADLFARATVVDLPGVRVPALEPTDALLHLAIHASLSGCNRLIWLQDIAALLGSGRVDLAEVVRRALAWGAGPSVAIALDRAARALGIGIDPEALGRLYGSTTLRALSRGLARAWPTERSTGQDPAALWAQLVRSTPRAALGAAVGRLGRAATVRPAGAEGHASLLPAGDRGDQAAFFAAVAAHVDP